MKTHLAALVDEVEAGESITITRHGRPVAQLVPLTTRKLAAAAAVEAILEMRKGNKLGDITIRELIEADRQY